ncbi:MAG: hypothetical protein H0Z28_11985 [Archaeoglobus sp.]|nr:hypothetical protein [Archaeoglobus sp.]
MVVKVFGIGELGFTVMKDCKDIDDVEFILINTANKPVDEKSCERTPENIVEYRVNFEKEEFKRNVNELIGDNNIVFIVSQLNSLSLEMEVATNIADTARKTNSYVVSFIHIPSAKEITNKNSEFYELLSSNMIFPFSDKMFNMAGDSQKLFSRYFLEFLNYFLKQYFLVTESLLGDYGISVYILEKGKTGELYEKILNNQILKRFNLDLLQDSFLNLMVNFDTTIQEVEEMVVKLSKFLDSRLMWISTAEINKKDSKAFLLLSFGEHDLEDILIS